MKKPLITLFAAFMTFSSAYARVPQIPRYEDGPKKGQLIDVADWNSLSATEQAEVGAFMLFYDLISQKKIGGDTGLCLSYQSGDAGSSEDKITIGLDSKSYPTGIASLNEVPKEKLENLKGLMKQIGRYLDSGCGADKAACKDGRSVSITGYADGQHYGKPHTASQVKTSIEANRKLAGERANLFRQLVDGEGFVNKDKVSVEGKPSPIGEYLQEGLPVPAEYNVAGVSKANYKIDCPERRVTVIDVKFNGNKVKTNSSNGTMSPVVKSASKGFVRLANMGVSIQTAKAAQSLGIDKVGSDAEADKLIEKIMDMNGIKSPEIRNACKNMQTRVMVKEHLRQIASQPRTVKEKIMQEMGSKSEGELLRLSATNTRQPAYAEHKEVIDYFKNMDDGFGGMENLKNYPLLATTGSSTTLNDCFSAKAAMQAEFSNNPALKSEMCQPVKGHLAHGAHDIDLKFHPESMGNGKSMHIGCQACMTGLRYVPKKYKNPETGKEESQMVPVFVDREANLGNKENPLLNNVRPIEPKEAEKLIADVQALSSRLNQELKDVEFALDHAKPGAEKLALIKQRQFLNNMRAMSDGVNVSQRSVIMDQTKPTDAFKMSDFDDPRFKELMIKTKISEEDLKNAKRYNQIMVSPVYGNMEKNYLLAKSQKQNGDDIKQYEQVILPGIKARDVLTNWDGKGSNQDVNNLSFGSLKKPRFYLLDNCNCDSPNLMEDAVTKGRALAVDEVPYDKAKQGVSENTCLISMPVPPSCMVNPNENGAKDLKNKEAENRIKWMGLNGENMDKSIAEMQTYLANNNKAVKLTGCEGLKPLEVAQRIVESAECAGATKVPQGEALDCKK